MRGQVVYIVDDDESVRAGLTRLIRSAGFEPKSFASAALFLEAALEKDAPACVVMDVTMPLKSGLELQARLKAKDVDIPVIAVSARDEEQTRSIARKWGAQFFLRKPVDDQALLDAIAWVSGAKHAAGDKA